MIREATTDDAETIAKIIVKTWKQAYAGIVDSGYPKSMKEENFAAIIRNNIKQKKETILVYEDNGLIKGFISGKIQSGIYDCEIIGFYILPDYQHKGIGTILLDRMKNHFVENGCKTMIIWTLLNAKNNVFYKGRGGMASESKEIEIGERKYPGVGFAFRLNSTMMEKIREYTNQDLEQMIVIWNEIVRTGNAFPQIETLNFEDAVSFFNDQSFTGVLTVEDDVAGLYILHPNNIGRCAHIANASYAVKSEYRGKGIGEKLLLHSIEKAKDLNFRILQFNAVTVTNSGALHLYKKLGFNRLGIIPGGFLSKSNEYVDIIPHYLELS